MKRNKWLWLVIIGVIVFVFRKKIKTVALPLIGKLRAKVTDVLAAKPSAGPSRVGAALSASDELKLDEDGKIS